MQLAQPQSRSTFSTKRRALLMALAAAIAAAPLLLASAPAEASAEPSMSAHGCTVTAKDPFHDGFTSNGQKIVRFRATFNCQAGVSSIKMVHEGYEDDGEYSETRLFSTSHGPYTVPASGGTGSWYVTKAASYWDGPADSRVELFHQVRFQVCSGPVCAWAPNEGFEALWLSSRTVTFYV